jgi:Tol biopolymer transport system component
MSPMELARSGPDLSLYSVGAAFYGGGMKRTRPAAWKRSTLLAFIVLATVAPASAEAAFPGKPGPIAYSQSTTDASELSGGIFAHPPRRGQKARQLTGVHGDVSPSYSAAGRSIAFAGNRDPVLDPNGSHIYVMNADGSGVRQLTSGDNYDSNPAFSPDGRRIAFDRAVGNNRTFDVYSVGADGSGLRQLTEGSSSDYEPTFTPDGRRIVFVSNRDSDGRHDRSAIYAMAADGSGPRVLINTPRNESEPDVSPNGRRIVFMSSRDGGLNIFVAANSGHHVRPLLKPVSTCIHRSCYSNPVFSPDEKHIAALYSSSYSTQLVVMRADGRGSSKTFATGGTEEEGYGTNIGPPSWGPAPR